MTNHATPQKLYQYILKQLRMGQIQVGDRLPSIRALSQKHSFSPVAVNQILKKLAKEGYLISEKAKSYQVIKLPPPLDTQNPIAYIMAEDPSFEQQEIHNTLRTALEKSAKQRHLPLLAISAPYTNTDLCLQQIKAANTSGIILDSYFSELGSKLSCLNIPIIQINSMIPNQFNCIIQDNFDGGLQAAEYLINKSHSNIAWVGNSFGSCHSFERFGGASAMLASKKVYMQKENILNYDNESDFLQNKNDIRKLLTKKNRPTAILCLWKEFALHVADIIDSMNLIIGKDIELVGWSIQENYQKDYKKHINRQTNFALITWPAKAMADIALDSLATIRTSPNAHKIRSAVPITLINTSNSRNDKIPITK